MGSPAGTVVRIDGGKIRHLREKKCLTQLYVATVVGVTTDTISRWENRHYNTVKHDNAVKLAEALELTLEEILLKDTASAPAADSAPVAEPALTSSVTVEPSSADAIEPPPPSAPESPSEPVAFLSPLDNKPNTPPSQSTEATQASKSPAPSDKPSFKTWIFAILLMGMLALLFWRLYPQSPATPPLHIQLTRALPPHAAPGQSFPVVIRIDGLGEEELPFILKEKLPEGFKPRNGIPPFTAVNEKGGSIKWISKASSATSPFCYMASVSPDTKEGKSSVFQGSITVKDGGSSTFPVTGQDTIDIAPFHWADTNRDLRIDDDEILAVHDTFGMIPSTDLKVAEIEALWSAGEYAWNPKKRQFTPKP